ncbi:DNA repair and recombination protein RadA [Candidatus Tiddalikarchaeum anstoanum]|nr:DNA repair and recombination protein RadA [Candidatus Tiddalikarchaeum anstoanum]
MVDDSKKDESKSKDEIKSSDERKKTIKTESDEVVSEIKVLEDLPGVGEKTAEKLREAGFSDIMSIAVMPAGLLCEVTEMTESAAQKVIGGARAALKMGFMSGNTLLDKRNDVGRIKFQSQELNTLFGGGIETQAISECFGQFGSGKTQIALQLAVNVQLPKKDGGLNGYAVIIDTENTFRPERIVQMAEALKLDPKKTLDKIKVARAYSSDHQMLLVDKISELIEKEKIPVKLVVVDSLMGLFRSEFAGRGTLATRQQKLNRHLHDLQRLADRHNLAIYVTNQVMAKPDIFFGDPTQACGGNVLGHASTYRVYLRRGKGDKRVARMIDSPCLPESECVFRVGQEGVRD